MSLIPDVNVGKSEPDEPGIYLKITLNVKFSGKIGIFGHVDIATIHDAEYIKLDNAAYTEFPAIIAKQNTVFNQHGISIAYEVVQEDEALTHNPTLADK